MSRSGYSEDYDGDGVIPAEFYYQAVERAKRGKRGQAFFADLVVALDAMPQKRLIADDLVAPTGEVCAIGALGKARGVDMARLNPEDAQRVGDTFGIAKSLAREVVFENDENSPYRSLERQCTKCHGWGEKVSAWHGRITYCDRCQGHGRRRVPIEETPENRWARMRAWAASQIVAPPKSEAS